MSPNLQAKDLSTPTDGIAVHVGALNKLAGEDFWGTNISAVRCSSSHHVPHLLASSGDDAPSCSCTVRSHLNQHVDWFMFLRKFPSQSVN